MQYFPSMSRIFVAGLLAVSVSVVGCDNVGSLNQPDFSTQEADVLFTTLSSELSLTTMQSSSLELTIKRSDGPARVPGYLWVIADSLSKTLTDEQIAELLDRTDRFEGTHAFRGLNGFPGGSSYYGVFGFFGSDRHHGEAVVDSVLNLSDAQRDSIQTIHKDYRRELKALRRARRDSTISAADYLAQRDQLRESTIAAVLDVLTPEQRAALDEFRQQVEADLEAYRAAVVAARDGVLGLSTEESDGFNAILADQLQAREVLTEQYQSGQISREEFHSEVQSLRLETETALQALLTEDQYLVVQIHNALAARMSHEGFKGKHGLRGHRDEDGHENEHGDNDRNRGDHD